MGFGGGSSGLSSPAQTKILVLADTTYEATSAEATKTFTIPAALQNADNVIGYLIFVDGTVDAAGTMELRARINGVSTNSYLSFGSRRIHATGVETAVTVAAAAQMTVVDVTALPAIDYSFTGWLLVMNTNTSGPQDEQPLVESSFTTIGANLFSQQMNHLLASVQATITSITILASTNWRIGTRITCYAIKRADT